MKEEAENKKKEETEAVKDCKESDENCPVKDQDNRYPGPDHHHLERDVEPARDTTSSWIYLHAIGPETGPRRGYTSSPSEWTWTGSAAMSSSSWGWDAQTSTSASQDASLAKKCFQGHRSCY